MKVTDGSPDTKGVIINGCFQPCQRSSSVNNFLQTPPILPISHSKYTDQDAHGSDVLQMGLRYRSSLALFFLTSNQSRQQRDPTPS
jgi:hypothetical protein